MAKKRSRTRNAQPSSDRAAAAKAAATARPRDAARMAREIAEAARGRQLTGFVDYTMWQEMFADTPATPGVRFRRGRIWA